jgi:hypothetical protein
VGWGGHPEQNQAESQRIPASGELCPCHKCSAEWPEWPYLVTFFDCRRSKGVAGRPKNQLHGNIYSKLGVKGQQVTLIKGRTHESGEAVMLGGHVRDVVADSPDTGKRL